MKVKKTIKQLVFYLFMTFLGLLAIVPFLWMISTSLKVREALYTIPIRWIPLDPSLDAYRAIFNLSNINFFRGLINSFIVSILLTFIPLLTSAMAAFAFAKIEFKGKKLLFTAFLFTMMVPGTITMIPNFITLKTLHLLNTYMALLLPALCNAFAIFFMRQSFIAIHDSYLEAAIIDGASLYRVFITVILPLARPVLFTMGLFNFMGSWNGFLWPLIVLSDRSKWTLQLGLANLGSNFYNYQNYLMAGALISIVPIIIVYVITQKYVEKGLSTGGLKG
ncbi:MAG: carbohydrate ABC transporter permease [Sphaerochaetaceae bacterium]|jgi:multiple sugar transport system permease protein|nr:carbohydrate ABC transporter permease [Sphaerochaetaceae bacterium]MDD4219311.1 carbohydrate ABC transporter permease [Sphaerochaetaceae bacterium]MDY0371134.1 carbohydrate ABC transporter permease [Sphaerochaetaceae bacterium]